MVAQSSHKQTSTPYSTQSTSGPAVGLTGDSYGRGGDNASIHERLVGGAEGTSSKTPPWAHAISSANQVLESILEACYPNVHMGNLPALTLHILKSAYPTNVFFYIVLDLMGYPFASIRLRAIKLLSFILATPDKTIDLRQVAAFEKINGFAIMGDRLSVPTTNEWGSFVFSEFSNEEMFTQSQLRREEKEKVLEVMFVRI